MLAITAALSRETIAPAGPDRLIAGGCAAIEQAFLTGRERGELSPRPIGSGRSGPTLRRAIRRA